MFHRFWIKDTKVKEKRKGFDDRQSLLSGDLFFGSLFSFLELVECYPDHLIRKPDEYGPGDKPNYFCEHNIPFYCLF
jgi:hypothetical protein